MSSSESDDRLTRPGRPRASGTDTPPIAGVGTAGAPVALDLSASSSLDRAATVDMQGASSPGGEPPAESELPYGGKIGRYLVLSVLGRGGMGVVYAAFDPVLDRKIAVKLLRYHVEDGETEGRARMQREAQALGRLNHGNVITVHDVGEHQGAMYIAMELVEGSTLREWQQGKPWREIVEAYLAAARGVAAAHAASLVHRDLKPENVLVGKDGRIRVTDFGLARLGVTEPRPGDARELALSPGSALTSSLTLAGAVMGTPFYMAPEQIDGGIVDARSDQFAFCIALWEAVYGEQPFPGTNLALRSAMMKAEPPVLPAKSVVPRAIGRALVRGMSGEPGDRWPTLDALATELRRSTSRGGSRRAALAVGLSVVAALAVVFALGHRAGATSEPDCTDAASAVDALWTPQVRDGVAHGFADTGAPYAAEASAVVDRNVTAWKQRWQAQAVGSCIATRAGTQSDQMLDLRSACLDKRRAEMATLVGALARADAALVERAPDLALPDLEACADSASLVGVAPAPRDPPTRARMASLDERLASIEGELVHGLTIPRARELLVPATLAVVDAQLVSWPPLLARAQRVTGNVQFELGDGKGARQSLLAAAAASQSAGDLDGIVDADLDLIDVDARVNSDYDLAQGWATLAKGSLAHLGPRYDKLMRLDRKLGYALQRSGRPRRASVPFQEALALAKQHGTPIDQLDALSELSAAEGESGNDAGSRDHANEALVLARAQLGADHPRIAAIEHDLGAAAIRTDHPADALPHLQKAFAMRQRLLGPDTVATAETEEALGIAELDLDQIDAATPHLEGALAILEQRLGKKHPDVANAMNDIGGAYHRAGLYDRALATAQRTLAMREAALGPDHPDVAQSLVNLAIEAKALGRWDLVMPAYARAIPIMDRAYGEASIEVGATHLNYAEALRVHGELAPAATEYERARTAIVAAAGADTPMLAHIWNGTGQLAMARGDLVAARPLLEKAVAIREHDAGDATALAESRFALARALPPTDHARAVKLALAARDVYRDGGKPFAAQRTAVEAWLAAHA